MRTAIVTGASGNLGQAVVRQFLKEGYQVTGTLEHAQPSAGDDPQYRTAVVDLTDESAAHAFVQQVITSQGGIDAAVLTVGGFAMGDIAETSSADLMKQYRLNVETAYHIARPVFMQMMKQGSGRIFLVGSRPGSDMRFSKGMTAYGLAKSLIFRIAELMNEEARGTNVVATVIVPSTIDTPQNRKSMPDADFSAWVKPEAIAEVICFHASPAAAALREPVIRLYGNA